MLTLVTVAAFFDGFSFLLPLLPIIGYGKAVAFSVVGASINPGVIYPPLVASTCEGLIVIKTASFAFNAVNRSDYRAYLAMHIFAGCRPQSFSPPHTRNGN